MGASNGLVKADRHRPAEPMSQLEPIQGRIPPHDLDAEAAVLSALLLDQDALGKVSDNLRPDQFYSEANRRIFQAILALAAKAMPIDLVSVAGELRDRERLEQVGGSAYLAQLADAVPFVAHVETYAGMVTKKWRVRQLIATCLRLAAEGYGDVGDVQTFLDAARSQVVELVEADRAKTPIATAAEIFAPLPPVNYMLEAFDICPGAPTMCAGYGYSMKTLSWQAAALAIATGRRVWNQFRARRGRVLHLDYEQGRQLTFRRYQRLAIGMGIDRREIDGNLVVLPLPSTYLDGAGAADALCRLAEGFDLVIVDSYRASCPSIEENSSAARIPLDNQLRASDRTGAAFVTIHHCRKPHEGANGGARMALRGSSAIYDALGSALIFEGSKGQPTKVTHDKARTSGVTAEDFYLEVVDVAVGGDPRAGVDVRTKAAEAVEVDPSERFAEACDVVLAAVSKHPGLSLRVLRQHIQGVRWDTTGAAVEVLDRAGKIVNLGSKTRPAWHVPAGTTLASHPRGAVPEAVPRLKGGHQGTTSPRGARQDAAPPGTAGTTHDAGETKGDS